MGVDSAIAAHRQIGFDWNDVVMWDDQMDANVVLQSTVKKWGGFAGQLDLDTNGNDAAIRDLLAPGHFTGGSNKGEGIAFWIRLSTAPTSDIILGAYGTDNHAKFLVLNTARQLEVWDAVDAGPTKLFTTTTTINTSGAMQLVTLFWDWDTVTNVWCHLWIDTTLEQSIDTGRTKTQWGVGNYINVRIGENLDAGVNRGCKVYLDGVWSFIVNTTAVLPHNADMLTGEFVGLQVPTVDEGTNDWNLVGAATDHEALDEVGHDGNTTRVDEEDPGIFFFVGASSDPITGTPKIMGVAFRQIGREADPEKGPAGTMFLKLSGTVLTMTREISDGTTYSGQYITVNGQRPGGGDWTAADFDVSGGEMKTYWGAKSGPDLVPADGVQPLITVYPGPEIVVEHADTLGAADTPGLAGIAPIRPLQAPSFGGVAHPSLADPILLARPEGAPLRELERAGASLRRRLKS